MTLKHHSMYNGYYMAAQRLLHGGTASTTQHTASTTQRPLHSTQQREQLRLGVPINRGRRCRQQWAKAASTVRKKLPSPVGQKGLSTVGRVANSSRQKGCQQWAKLPSPVGQKGCQQWAKLSTPVGKITILGRTSCLH